MLASTMRRAVQTNVRRGIPAASSSGPFRGFVTASDNPTLSDADPEMYALLMAEKKRQQSCLELIASENFTSRAVMETLGSCLTNKYAEGQIGNRYYGGTEVVDKVEALCQQRALQAYGLDPEEWHVNVQPYSGSPANFAAYTALLEPHDRMMGLDLPSGGHLTHGFFTVNPKTGVKKAISASAVYFDSQPYKVDPSTGVVDYDQLAEQAAEYKPNLLIYGGSAYPHEWDHVRFREIADSVGAYLMMDMAHISGLVAAGEQDSPFGLCDVVTSTTHKTLRGPRSGLIFARKDERGLHDKCDFATFPMLQGGPHEHQIGALAVQLKEVCSPEWKGYIQEVRKNASTLADSLVEAGYTVSSGGTTNHLLLWDLRPTGVTGNQMEKICDAVNITLNKNTVPGDEGGALQPGGVRIGTSAMTTRGLNSDDFKKVCDLLDRTVKVAQRIKVETGCEGKKIKAYKQALITDAGVEALRQEVEEMCTPLFMPGIHDL